MKKLIPILIMLSACSTLPKSFVQVYQTKALAPVQSADNGHYVFENDSIRIDYDFWCERGIIAFKIENKLNVPLYIDWSRSSFVKNGEKLDLWRDQQKISSSSSYNSSTISADFWHNLYTSYRPGYTVNYGFPYTLGITQTDLQTTTTVTKQEKTTFIAPHSYIFPFTKFTYLFKAEGTKLRTDRDYEVVTIKNNPPLKVKRYYADYAPDETILKFRNFLTLSTSKDFTTEFYVDHAFYVSKIYEMQDIGFTDSLKRPNSFFLHINPALAIDSRTQP